MRFLLRFLLILGLSFAAQLFMPFWSVAVVAFLVGLALSQRRKKRLYGKDTPPARAFLAGFLAIFLLWGIAAFWFDARNGSQLSVDIFTLLFQSPDLLPMPAMVMVLLTAMLGGLLSGCSAMTGNLLGEAIRG